MQSKDLITILVTIVGMFAYTSAQCQPKQPMTDYSPDVLEGKFYLVTIEKAFSYQIKETRCSTSEVDDASLQTFPFVVTYQDNNGSPQTLTLIFENSSPPGTFNITGGDGANFEVVMLGAIQGKVQIFYGCNNKIPEDDRVAVWIYYSSRVQGFDQMDADTQRYVRRLLDNNNISRNDLQDVNNRNCNNN